MRLPALVVLLSAFVVASGASAGDGVWGPTHGPRPGPVVALAVHPKRPATVYAGTPLVWDDGKVASRGALYSSTDGGRQWVKSRLEGVTAVVVDPRRSNTVYVGTRYDGVFKSTDGGRSWRAANAGLGAATVARLAIAPRSGTVYAGTGVDTGYGIYRSTDGGRRWRLSGLDENFVDALAIDARKPATLYAAVWDPSLSGSGEDRIVKTTNAGRTWVELRPGLVSEYVPALAVDPRNSSTLYAGTDRGVFKSTDGGRRWLAAGLAGLGGVAALVAIDPRRPQVLYAATAKGVYRSLNGGRSWSRFSRGLTTSKITSLAIATNGRVLYAGTDAGVFDIRLRG